MSNDDEPFLKRWSRRKGEAREGAPAPAAGDASAAEGASVEPGRDAAPAAPAANAAPTRELTEADFADVDFSKLDMQSDYTRFLEKGVPESIKQRALQQLWSSDPVFSSVEVFNEYGGDFTDKAVAVAPGTLQTAWRVGKGFLTDAEAAEWEKLGVPEKVNGEPGKIAGAPADTLAIVAEHADQADVQGLLARAGADPVPSGGQLLVARRDGVAVACAAITLVPSGDWAEVTHTVLAPSDAASGAIAEEFLRAVEAAARASGARRLRIMRGSPLTAAAHAGGYSARDDIPWLERACTVADLQDGAPSA